MLILMQFRNYDLKAQKDIHTLGRTGMTSFNAAPPKNINQKKKIRYIVKPNTKNLLLGNKCAEDESLRMGFKYVAIPKGQPGNTSNIKRNVNNLGTKTILLFKNGPFWKHRLKRRIDKCKSLTGDFVG